MNVLSIRQKVAKAISKVPTEIVLKRYAKTSDGMGGYTLAAQPDTITTISGLLDNSKHSFISPSVIDAGTIKRERTNRLIVVYSDDFTILADDFFEVGGTTYKINNAADILNLNIYWECDLEVIKNG